MNIFMLHSNPEQAARYHCDKHVVKMVLETAQLLCTAQNELSVSPGSDLYKSTHKNHPAAKWVRSTEERYRWTYELFVHLCDEYSYRFNNVHATGLKFKNNPSLTDPPLVLKNERIGRNLHDPEYGLGKIHSSQFLPPDVHWFPNFFKHELEWLKSSGKSETEKMDWYKNQLARLREAYFLGSLNERYLDSVANYLTERELWIQLYRFYYVYEKRDICTWTNRTIPTWFTDIIKADPDIYWEQIKVQNKNKEWRWKPFTEKNLNQYQPEEEEAL